MTFFELDLQGVDMIHVEDSEDAAHSKHPVLGASLPSPQNEGQ